MTLYVDVLFAINFSMDFLSLFITEMILHKKIHKKRILVSATIGGLYSVLELLVPTKIILGATINVCISFIMCYVAFKENRLGKLTGMIVLFWGVSASLGGIMSLLYSFLNNLLYEYIRNYSYSQAYNGARFFIIASLTMIVAIVFSRLYKSQKNIREVTITVLIKNTSFNLKGICDSGNLLTEPITGKSVILVSNASEVGQLIDKEKELKKRYIPYHGIEKNGILKGIVPEKILVNNSEISAIIATIENKSFAGYDALVPISLV